MRVRAAEAPVCLVVSWAIAGAGGKQPRAQKEKRKAEQNHIAKRLRMSTAIYIRPATCEETGCRDSDVVAEAALPGVLSREKAVADENGIRDRT